LPCARQERNGDGIVRAEDGSDLGVGLEILHSYCSASSCCQYHRIDVVELSPFSARTCS